ncbi:hypothetical protein M8J75_016373 [Diaphorina citri]|nr:hypothetical protein M8J75_016373 [Diaphorina citri]
MNFRVGGVGRTRKGWRRKPTRQKTERSSRSETGPPQMAISSPRPENGDIPSYLHRPVMPVLRNPRRNITRIDE